MYTFTCIYTTLHFRSDYKNDRMDQDKIDKLNEVGFVWDYFKDGLRRDS